jgi:hypothetical protein
MNRSITPGRDLGQYDPNYLRLSGAELVIDTTVLPVPTTLRVGRIWGEAPSGFITAELLQYDQFGYLLIPASGSNISVPVTEDIMSAWNKFKSGTETAEDVSILSTAILNSPQARAHVQ